MCGAQIQKCSTEERLLKCRHTPASSSEVSSNKSMSSSLSFKTAPLSLDASVFLWKTYYGGLSACSSLPWEDQILPFSHVDIKHLCALLFCRQQHSISNHDICILYLSNNKCQWASCNWITHVSKPKENQLIIIKGEVNGFVCISKKNITEWYWSSAHKFWRTVVDLTSCL